MFWGMTLYPGVEYTREITRPEYLTLAALDCRPQMNRGETNLTAYLVLKCDNYEHVLCTLVQGHAHQQILNFVMQEGEKMTLTVEGSGIVHVTGYTFKQLVLSDDTDTRTETTLMREVSDGIQDGEVLSPLPSSEGDDCTIIDEDFISEVKYETLGRCDLEAVDTEGGPDEQFMGERTLLSDVVRDGTGGTDPEGAAMNMDTDDYRHSAENNCVSNDLLEVSRSCRLHEKDKLESRPDQQLMSRNSFLTRNETEDTIGSNDTPDVPPESSVTNMTTNDHRWLNRENSITNNGLMQDTCNYALHIKEETEQISNQHVNCKNAVLRSNQTEAAFDSDVSTHAASESSTLNRGANIHRQPTNREVSVSNNNIIENTTNYTSYFEAKQEQASNHHLTNMHAILTSNGRVASDGSTHATVESSDINTDINDYKGPNRGDTDYTSEFEEEREPASEQHLTSTNAIMNSNRTESAVDSDKNTIATAESSTIDADENDCRGSNKEDGVSADSVMENTTDYTSGIEEEREQASGQHMTRANAIMNSNEKEGAVDYDKSTPATAEFSTINTDTHAYRGPNKEGTVPADSVVELDEAETILEGSSDSITQGPVTYQQKELPQASCELLGKNVNNAVNSEAMENWDVLIDSGPCQARWKTKRCIVLLKRIDKLFSNYADSHLDGTSFLLKFNSEKVTVKDDLGDKERNHTVKPAITSQSSVRMCNGRTLFKCQLCLKTFSTLDSLTRHSNINICGEFSECDQSGEKLNDKAHLKTHERIHTGQNSSKGNLCLMKLHYKTQYNLHKRIHTCKHCDKKFYWKASLMRHERIHSGEKPYTCKYCDEKFRWKRTLQIHESKHTGEKQLTCEHCSKKFSHKLSLQWHKRIHNVEKPFTCKWCDKKFPLKQYLDKHARIHTGEKPFTCSHCNKNFRQRGTLKSHERIHTREEKSLTCTYCSRKFSRNKDLKEHERGHTGEMPYTCKHCDRKFGTKGSLHLHEKMHTGKKPFTCDHCDMKFYRNSGLIRHKRIHTGEKPYTCKFCYKKFNQKSYLKRHERIHTNETPYSCEHCDKKFRWRNRLIAHESVHTSMNRSTGEHCGNEISQKANLRDNESINSD